MLRLLMPLLLSILLTAPASAAGRDLARDRGFRVPPIEDDPRLPRVLLLGDSITRSYAIAVRASLKGRVNVHFDFRPGTRDLRSKSKRIPGGKWDLIHFNQGFHDLKYMAGRKRANPPRGRQVTPPDVYEKNLQKIVQRLKLTGAALVWRMTAPIPEGSVGVVDGDVGRYNDIARRVMESNEVQVLDLNDWILSEPVPYLAPGNLHFSFRGSQMLGERVAEAIWRRLEEERARAADASRENAD